MKFSLNPIELLETFIEHAELERIGTTINEGHTPSSNERSLHSGYSGCSIRVIWLDSITT